MQDEKRTFIDTNILVYCVYGTSDQKEIIGEILSDRKIIAILSTQVLKEFTNVSIKKKLHKTLPELKRHLSIIQQSFIIFEINTYTIFDALDIKESHKYSFYDSLIIASAIESKCATIYSEDMHHGQIIKKQLKISNPFI